MNRSLSRPSAVTTTTATAADASTVGHTHRCGIEAAAAADT
jgi:hypothetical protein